MVSKTIIGSSVTLWVFARPGIKEWQRSKIHRRGPHPLEPGLFPVFLGHIRPPDGCPMVAFLAKQRDDPLDFRQGHAVSRFLSGPRCQRAVVVIEMSVGAE